MIPIHHAQCVLIISSRAFSHLDTKKKMFANYSKKRPVKEVLEHS